MRVYIERDGTGRAVVLRLFACVRAWYGAAGGCILVVPFFLSRVRRW